MTQPGFKSNLAAPAIAEGDFVTPRSPGEVLSEAVQLAARVFESAGLFDGSQPIVTIGRAQPRTWRLRFRDVKIENAARSLARDASTLIASTLVANRSDGSWSTGIQRRNGDRWEWTIRIPAMNPPPAMDSREDFLWAMALEYSRWMPPDHVLGWYGVLGNPYYAYSLENPTDDRSVLWGYGWLVFLSSDQVSQVGGITAIRSVPVDDIVTVDNGVLVRLCRTYEAIPDRLSQWNAILSPILRLPPRIRLAHATGVAGLDNPPIGVLRSDWSKNQS